ncbi:hypothetical protein AI2983V1_0496 [Enterobacter cloacae]|uniref:hypothetical protein n=1 Tax=Enterobacterales TaxID=91347 RepID=UPI00076C9EA9|nr:MULTISPECIES: hypothetical protein [Enterobacterales]CAF3100917.1 hypothetical protein AI2983V1_0496 [Enterobacter cloacae]HDR2484335.1 hypothetical protein [Enterobacter roggenkampii]KVJ38900.1 hypothetical protein AWS33_07645 [Enterobacter cloacae subsp. cloacae]MEB5972739.1 hypothetical protein [Pantoea dispersa]CAH5481676.1 hypothetical protein AI2983V1_0496 [Enterobacter cloacae]
MAGSGFLLPMVAGVALSCVSYGFVARIVSKRQISTLRAVSWGILATLSLVLGMCAFSAVSAEHPAAKNETSCLGNAPECYAKAHHNPVKECKQVMDKKATFRHVWQQSEAQPVFSTYLWHDENKRTIQMFGQQAKAINSLGMQIPLQYFCVFNANTGEVIAASFE